MTDPRARLRQYLEQRRELGESEFVLDSLSVEDAMRALGSAPTEPRSGAPAASTRSTSPAPSAQPVRPPSDGPPPSARANAVSEDWRAVVNAPDEAKVRVPPPPAVEPPVNLEAARSLAEVAAAIAVCKSCSLSATAINHVPGEGNPAATFVVVGEAPGATEDELGRPFVGKSGDLLTKILEAIQFKREDVFICNVLKHRPPGNRNPSKSEVVACRPFLLRQLELLKPKVILALGTFAAQTLLESDAAIGTLRGTEHTYHGIPLVATYHPAALLRNPNWKRPAWEDVQLARRIHDRA